MSHPQLLEQYMRPLIRGERRSCRQIVQNALDTGLHPRAFIEDVLWPAMETIDKLYRHDKINSVNEHMATRINRLIANQLQARLPHAPPHGRRVVMACAHDEPEELGAQMCSDLFEADGWDVYFVGGGVPHDEVLALVGELRPAMLLVFGSKPSDAPRIRELITLIRHVNAAPEMNVMVAGGVFNRAEGLWQEVQADLFAPTARDALTLANQARPRQAEPPRMDAPKKRRRRRKTQAC